jgi:hypothetical protein
MNRYRTTTAGISTVFWKFLLSYPRRHNNRPVQLQLVSVQYFENSTPQWTSIAVALVISQHWCLLSDFSWCPISASCSHVPAMATRTHNSSVSPSFCSDDVVQSGKSAVTLQTNRLLLSVTVGLFWWRQHQVPRKRRVAFARNPVTKYHRTGFYHTGWQRRTAVPGRNVTTASKIIWYCPSVGHRQSVSEM